MMSASELIEQVTRWAAGREDVLALALVGSWARGTAGPGSDVDFVLLCSDPRRYLASREWVTAFGAPGRIEAEDWGLLRSLRVFYGNGLEVEFGVGTLEWVASPPPPGTMEVLAGGVVVLLDRDGSLTALSHRARAPGPGPSPVDPS